MRAGLGGGGPTRGPDPGGRIVEPRGGGHVGGRAPNGVQAFHNDLGHDPVARALAVLVPAHLPVETEPFLKEPVGGRGASRRGWSRGQGTAVNWTTCVSSWSTIQSMKGSRSASMSSIALRRFGATNRSLVGASGWIRDSSNWPSTRCDM